MTITCKDGDYEFYIVSYARFDKGGLPARNILIRVPVEQSPAARIWQLTKEGALENGWSSVTLATAEQIEWWVNRHPEKMISKSEKAKGETA